MQELANPSVELAVSVEDRGIPSTTRLEVVHPYPAGMNYINLPWNSSDAPTEAAALNASMRQS